MSKETSDKVRVDGSGARWTYTRRGYALAQSLRQLKQHRIASLATLLVLGITLALPAILYFAYPNLASLSHRSLQGESMTAYLGTEVTDVAGAELANTWAARADIARTDYISKEQSLALLADVSDISSAIELLGENPLPGAIVVYPNSQSLTVNGTDQLSRTLGEVQEVEQVQMDLSWVRRLAAVVSLIAWVGGLLAAFLILSALLVIANTIRLELARRKNEMDVMHLLGAPNHVMNRPIIYTGALYGLLGGLIGCFIGLLALNTIRKPADTLSTLYQNGFSLSMPTVSQFFVVILVCLSLGIMGAIGSLYRPAQQLTYRR